MMGSDIFTLPLPSSKNKRRNNQNHLLEGINSKITKMRYSRYKASIRKFIIFNKEIPYNRSAPMWQCNTVTLWQWNRHNCRSSGPGAVVSVSAPGQTPARSSVRMEQPTWDHPLESKRFIWPTIMFRSENNVASRKGSHLTYFLWNLSSILNRFYNINWSNHKPSS